MVVIVIFIHIQKPIYLRKVYIYIKGKKTNPVYIQNTESSLEQ